MHVDVGANVGDTWALTRPATADRTCWSRARPAFFELLTLNTSREPGVTRVAVLLADEPGAAPGGMVVEAGNARVDVDAAAGARGFETLDRVIDQHPEGSAPRAW